MCKKLTFEDVRPDLKRYYKPELNGGKLMNDFSKGSNKKIILCCDVCGHLKEPEMVERYTRLKKNGSFNTGFKCVYCNSLKILYPDLAKEWNIEKNELSSSEVFAKSLQKAWWKCEKGHEWEAVILSRAQGNGCPYCSGRNLTNANSFGLNHPDIAKEWHPTLNGDVTPYDVTRRTAKKYWWACDKGHVWKASIAGRTGGSNCPTCNCSRGEKIIAKWLMAQNIKYETQFFVKINNKKRFFDFYLPELKLFIEVHGIQHFEDASSVKSIYAKKLEEQQQIDKQKQEYAEENGTFLMVDYREHNPELALDRFIDALAELA